MAERARTIFLAKMLETEIRLELDSILRGLGYTTTQYTMLSVIENAKTPYSSAGLARRLRITPQSANETVASLDRNRLLLKKSDPNNGRALLLSLSAKGKVVLERLDRQVDDAEARLFSVLSERELGVFREQLRRIVAARRSGLVQHKPERKAG
ncbi:MAG: MarR family transcriptional regulator [Beijerinckiaceae bacterium]